MKKLMIGEVSRVFTEFELNTIHIKQTTLLNILREEFCDYFGKADFSFFSRMTPKRYTTTEFRRSFSKHKWFNVNEKAVGAVKLTQDHKRPKGRRYQIKMYHLDGFSEEKDMVPFIKFYANPQGILILEKIMFEYTS